jgi:hypothetical protein
MFSTLDKRKVLLTTRNARLDSCHYATKYHFCSGKMRRYSSGGCSKKKTDAGQNDRSKRCNLKLNLSRLTAKPLKIG